MSQFQLREKGFSDGGRYGAEGWRGVAVTSSEHGERRVRMEDGERRIEAPGTRETRRRRQEVETCCSNELTIIANH